VAESCTILQFSLQTASPETFGYTLVCAECFSGLLGEVKKKEINEENIRNRKKSAE
jgi:hypothetical protein